MILIQKHSIPSAGKVLFSLCVVFTHSHLRIGGGNEDAYSRMGYFGANQPPSISGVEVLAEQIQRLGNCHQVQLDALDWLKDTHVSTYSDVERHRAHISRARAQVTSLQWYKLDDALNQESEILNTLVERLDEAFLLASKLDLHLSAVSFGILAIERCYKDVESRAIRDIGDIEHLGFLLVASLEELAIISSAQK